MILHLLGFKKRPAIRKHSHQLKIQLNLYQIAILRILIKFQEQIIILDVSHLNLAQIKVKHSNDALSKSCIMPNDWNTFTKQISKSIWGNFQVKSILSAIFSVVCKMSIYKFYLTVYLINCVYCYRENWCKSQNKEKNKCSRLIFFSSNFPHIIYLIIVRNVHFLNRFVTFLPFWF